MRLIDADALIAELQKDEERFDKEAEDAKDDPSYTEGYSDAMWSRANGIRDAIVEIYDAPSIDIMRCAECKHWRNTDAEKIPTASIACGNMHADDFCSYGERKDKCKECWHWSEAHKRCENKGGCQFKPYGEREGE